MTSPAAHLPPAPAERRGSAGRLPDAHSSLGARTGPGSGPGRFSPPASAAASPRASTHPLPSLPRTGDAASHADMSPVVPPCHGRVEGEAARARVLPAISRGVYLRLARRHLIRRDLGGIVLALACAALSPEETVQ